MNADNNVLGQRIAASNDEYAFIVGQISHRSAFQASEVVAARLQAQALDVRVKELEAAFLAATGKPAPGVPVDSPAPPSAPGGAPATKPAKKRARQPLPAAKP